MRCDRNNELLGMLEPKCQVPIYKGDQPANVFYKASSRFREADCPGQKGELPITVDAKRTRWPNGYRQRRASANADTTTRNRFTSQEEAEATTSSGTLSGTVEYPKFWPWHLQAACTIPTNRITSTFQPPPSGSPPKAYGRSSS